MVFKFLIKFNFFSDTVYYYIVLVLAYLPDCLYKSTKFCLADTFNSKTVFWIRVLLFGSGAMKKRPKTVSTSK